MVFQSKIQNSFTVTVVAEQIALPVDPEDPEDRPSQSVTV